MGYDIHITRAELWAINEGQEIAANEWLQFIGSDPELIPVPENGKYFVLWRGTTKYPETWFDWHAGNITTKYPDKATLYKMLQMAAALGGKVQGDDGEEYDEASIRDLDESYIDAGSSTSQLHSASGRRWWSSVRKLFRRV